MDTNIIITQLKHNTLVIDAMLSGISVEQARWKPAADKWSALEIICHLYDEEKKDFRPRLDYTLHKPGQAWPPTDPAGWVISRNYARQNVNIVKLNFLDERNKTVTWLNTLTKVNWDKSYNHPQYGLFLAGDLLVSWLAHDYRHIRQLANLQVLYMKYLAKPYSCRYAGD